MGASGKTRTIQERSDRVESENRLEAVRSSMKQQTHLRTEDGLGAPVV